MGIDEVIAQLLSLRENCESFLEENEPDSIWAKDIKAIDIAISMLEKKATDGRQAGQ